MHIKRSVHRLWREAMGHVGLHEKVAPERVFRRVDIYIHIYTYTYTNIHAYAYIYIYMHKCIYISVHLFWREAVGHVGVFFNRWLHSFPFAEYTNIHITIYIHISIYTYMCVPIYMYICVYIYISVYFLWRETVGHVGLLEKATPERALRRYGYIYIIFEHIYIYIHT